jgi:hypothetical protein
MVIGSVIGSVIANNNISGSPAARPQCRKGQTSKPWSERRD